MIDMISDFYSTDAESDFFMVIQKSRESRFRHQYFIISFMRITGSDRFFICFIPTIRGSETGKGGFDNPPFPGEDAFQDITGFPVFSPCPPCLRSSIFSFPPQHKHHQSSDNRKDEYQPHCGFDADMVGECAKGRAGHSAEHKREPHHQ